MTSMNQFNFKQDNQGYAVLELRVKLLGEFFENLEDEIRREYEGAFDLIDTEAFQKFRDECAKIHGLDPAGLAL